MLGSFPNICSKYLSVYKKKKQDGFDSHFTLQVQLVQKVIDDVKLLIKMEQRLHQKQDIAPLLPYML